MLTAADVLDLLPSLAERRPVFHSEADFQHALAWHIQSVHPNLRVRLETRPMPRVHLDLQIVDPSDGLTLAIELKYFTRKWEGVHDGERFVLNDQGAQDVRAYDFVKDIARIERLVADGYAHSGLVLAITNDPSYWRTPTHGRVTNADAFRLHDGLTLVGSRVWGPNTGAGTTGTGRAAPIELAGTHPLIWRDFSHLDDARGGQFRYLAVPISAANDHA